MCFCWLEKRNTSLFSEDIEKLFGCKIPKHVIERRFPVKQLCHVHCSWQVPHRVTPSEKIIRRYVRRLAKIPQANSKRTSAYPTKIGKTVWFRLFPPLSSFFWSWRNRLRRHSYPPECTYVLLFWRQITAQILLVRFNWLIGQGVELLVTRQ